MLWVGTMRRKLLRGYAALWVGTMRRKQLCCTLGWYREKTAKRLCCTLGWYNEKKTAKRLCCTLGWYNEKENNRAVSRREVMGFQFWLKRVKTNAWQREEESSRSQIWCIERISSQGPSAHPMNTEDPSIPSEQREQEREKRWSNSERYEEAVPETMWRCEKAGSFSGHTGENIYIYACTPSQHLMRGHSHCMGSSVHSPCPRNIVVLCGWSWHYAVAPLTYI